MKIKRVMVGAWPFRVLRIDGFSDKTGALGTCGTDSQEIVIDSKLGPDVEMATIAHEALHGFISQTMYAEEWGKEEEEKVVRTFDPFLYTFIRDNRDYCEEIWRRADV